MLSADKKSWIRRKFDRATIVARRDYYSQLGEDAVLSAYFKEIKGIPSRWRTLLNIEKVSTGFYIDVGAYSPKRLSNTYLLYRQGWRGVTIEPNPVVANDFRKARPGDIHLQAAVSNQRGTAYYCSIGYAATNFICADSQLSHPGMTVSPVEVLRLSDVFERYAKGRHVDLLSVDCEGHDLTVLQSNDWVRNRPGVVLAEDHCDGLQGILVSPIVKFMQENGYDVFSWTLVSVMFKDVAARIGDEIQQA